MAEYTRAHVFLSGKVQGVLFRRYAQKKAQELEVTGWVHNLIDTRLEIVCEGDAGKVEEFLSFMKKGPSLARVKDTEVSYEEYTGEWKEFKIREFGF